MLTVRHDDTDVLAGLEAGADDYVAKDSAGAIVLGRVRRLIQFRQMSSMAMLNQQLVQVGRLLAGIVHEIRGPLAVIRGSAELLLYTDSPESEDSSVDRLDSAELTVAPAPARPSDGDGAEQLVAVPDHRLPPLLRESVQLFLKGLSPGARKIEVEVGCDDDVPTVRIDPGRLMQVLFNLLGNAQQALARLDRGARSCSGASTAEDEGRAWVVVDIVDDGPGVPEAYIDRIFEPFFTTREDGTGYGLYLAAEILKEQSGRLTVRNNRRRGSHVYDLAAAVGPARGGGRPGSRLGLAEARWGS